MRSLIGLIKALYLNNEKRIHSLLNDWLGVVLCNLSVHNDFIQLFLKLEQKLYFK